ncbi:MAG: hypothetical protein KAQ98_11580 [Bacteriovoracaceae bacterium]|nr:hypothetical protein [Bacteriovoracaceae bacterium]
MRKLFAFFIILILTYAASVEAVPRNVEVWFLSAPKTASINELLDSIEKMEFYSMLVEVDPYECVPMGDGCFHPQTGFSPKKPMVLKKVIRERPTQLKTINAVDVSLVECDKNNYFDIFCGKSKKIKKLSKNRLEIWVDISASLRQVDYSKKPDYCERRSFVAKVIDNCPENKVQVAIFNTAIKEMGDLASLCANYGLNNEDRLIEWIERSEAEKVIVITDINEYSSKFSDYLESIGATIKGVGVTGIFAKELVDMSSEVISYCKKL